MVRIQTGYSTKEKDSKKETVWFHKVGFAPDPPNCGVSSSSAALQDAPSLNTIPGPNRLRPCLGRAHPKFIQSLTLLYLTGASRSKVGTIGAHCRTSTAAHRPLASC